MSQHFTVNKNKQRTPCRRIISGMRTYSVMSRCYVGARKVIPSVKRSASKAKLIG